MAERAVGMSWRGDGRAGQGVGRRVVGVRQASRGRGGEDGLKVLGRTLGIVTAQPSQRNVRLSHLFVGEIVSC